MSRVTTVGGKQAMLSEPFRARAGVPLVGRDREIRLLMAAWMGDESNPPYSPLLVGEAGVGKNALVYELANLTGKSLYIFNGHEDVTADDLSCTVRFSDDSSRRMDYVLSPLATAMLEGQVCLFDEVAKSRPQALAALLSVCDERRYIDSTLLGERIHAAPGFRLVAATNTADLDGNFPEALRSRLRPAVPVGLPAEAEINDILKSRYEERFRDRVTTHVEPLLEQFWQLWRNQRPEAPPTPRDAIHIFGLALNLADQTNAVASSQPIPGNAGLASLVIALEGAVDAFFSAELQARR